MEYSASSDEETVSNSKGFLMKALGACVLQFVIHVVLAFIVGFLVSTIILVFQWEEVMAVIKGEVSITENLKLLAILAWVVFLPIILIGLSYKNALKKSVSILLGSQKENWVRSVVSDLLAEDSFVLMNDERNVVDILRSAYNLPFPLGSILGLFLNHVGFNEKFLQVAQKLDDASKSEGDTVDLITSELTPMISSDMLKPSYKVSIILAVSSLVLAFI